MISLLVATQRATSVARESKNFRLDILLANRFLIDLHAIDCFSVCPVLSPPVRHVDTPLFMNERRNSTLRAILHTRIKNLFFWSGCKIIWGEGLLRKAASSFYCFKMEA
jgi:hypothetical protein